MGQDTLLEKIWSENELAALARSARLFDQTAESIGEQAGTVAFLQLARLHRHPIDNWQGAVLRVWEILKTDFSHEHSELNTLLSGLETQRNRNAAREKIRLWLWRRVVQSGNQCLMTSRFFADPFLFHRTLQEERLLLWYGDRQAEWPVQLLLGLFLGSHAGTSRLRLHLYWPTAKLPQDFSVSRIENRALRRLWEARILVRFGTYAHLHPQIMLLLPEVSSFTSPVFEWRDHELRAHMPDGHVWAIAPFSLAALVFDESLALFGRDRRALWRNFVAYARDFLRRPDDVASSFALEFFCSIGLYLMQEASRTFLAEFAEGIQFLESLRVST